MTLAHLAKRLDRTLVEPGFEEGRASICNREPGSAQVERAAGIEAIDFSAFAAYARRRSRFGRRPLRARWFVVTGRPGANQLPDVVDAAIGLEQLPEWPCLRPAALSFARQPVPRLLRPGLHAVETNAIGLMRFGEFIERVLTAPTMRKSVDVIVITWQFDIDLYRATASD